MKAKLLSLVAAIAFVVIAASCTSVKPNMLTNNSIGTKVGQASANFLFGFPLAGGDYSLKTAAANGGIDQIATVDLQVFDVINLWQVRTTIVTGN